MADAIEGGEYDLVIPQGRTFRKIFTYVDDNGVRLSLMGYAGAGSVRKSKDDDTGVAVLTFTVTVNQAAVGVAGCGDVLIELTAAETADFKTFCYHDIYLTKNAEKHPFLAGRVIPKKSVTV